MDFSLPLAAVLDLSTKKLQLFARAGVSTLGELLLHLPSNYQDRSRVTPIDALLHEQPALVHAQVLDSRVTYGRRRMLHVSLQDHSGSVMSLRYFHFYPNQQRQFTNGRWGLFYAKAQLGNQGFEFHHPEITWLKDGQAPQLDESLCAIYPTVSGLTQKDWQRAIAVAFTHFDQTNIGADPLCEAGFLNLEQALRQLHYPEQTQTLATIEAPIYPPKQRLIIEELCAHQLSIAQARRARQQLQAPQLPTCPQAIQSFSAQLPFELTQAQQSVYQAISTDLSRTQPMMRLVQGDVGSGKTIVAALAILQTVKAGAQAVLLVPTELLAEQHATNLARLFEAENINVALLVSKLAATPKRAVLSEIKQGAAQVIVGTHAVFQKQVDYHNLALLIIDEQHRFGVHQRLSLQDKTESGASLHQLVLTATPIPRTLAMSIYGELDVSVIDELPKGRKPIQTAVVSNDKRQTVIARVGENCRQGKQAYWVCPLIEESEVLECENAQSTAEQLQQALPDVRVGLIHGRMATDERQQTMHAFIQGDVQLLVATTVIEVGVDVANASLMIIENAERFGLAQLHQLRGRVGRGSEQSYCLLMYQAPLGETARRRLNIMRNSQDGFVIAEEDLAIRGAGELLGTRQTGAKLLKIADLERDQALLDRVNDFTQQWLTDEPDFVDELLSRWVSVSARYLQA